MTYPHLTLISHDLCPFVQRAAIALLEQGVPFERRYIDLMNKPDWFLELSPLGKVPVLVIDDDKVLFESSAIAQYIDGLSGGDLLSRDLFEKSQQLAWMEFASQLIADIGRLYNAASDADFQSARERLSDKLQRIENHLPDSGWFSGDAFSLVDAAFAPALRYFDVIDELTADSFFASTPRVARWRLALALRPSVRNAVSSDYTDRLRSFIARRDSLLGSAARMHIGLPIRAA